MIALSHLSLFVSDWRRQVGGLLVKTYRHGISEIFLKMVLNTKKTKTNQTIRPLIILRFVSVTSQGLDFQCRILWVFCVHAPSDLGLFWLSCLGPFVFMLPVT
jgi:hypothetical protein